MAAGEEAWGSCRATSLFVFSAVRGLQCAVNAGAFGFEGSGGVFCQRASFPFRGERNSELGAVRQPLEHRLQPD